MKIGVISAMESEHNRLVACLDGKQEVYKGAWQYMLGRLGNNEAVLARCGIGKVNAAVGAAELLRQFAPDCVVSTGVAGGIDTSLQVMDVVAGASVVYHDVWCGEGNAYGQVQGLPAVFDADPVLLAHALSMDKAGEGNRVYGGLICTGDRFITDRPSLNAIKSHFPQGLAVDMESAAIAQTCYLYGVPFLSFRIISDTPGVENHWQQYTDFWGAMADRSFQITQAFLATLPGMLK